MRLRLGCVERLGIRCSSPTQVKAQDVVSLVHTLLTYLLTFAYSRQRGHPDTRLVWFTHCTRLHIICTGTEVEGYYTEVEGYCIDNMIRDTAGLFYRQEAQHRLSHACCGREGSCVQSTHESIICAWRTPWKHGSNMPGFMNL